MNILLTIALLLGMAAISSSIWNALVIGRRDLAVWYGGLLVALAAVTFARQIWFELRAAVLVGLPLAAGIVELFQFGATRDSSVLLFAAVLLCALFLGWRWSVVVLALSLATLAWVSWQASSGQFAFIRNPGIAFVDATSLATSWVLFLTLSIIVMSAILSLIARLTQSLQLAEAANQAAVASREQAEQLARQLQQRMGDLEAQYATEHQLRDLVAVLETSTVSLRDGVLLAPIVGIIDSRRAERLMSRLLTEADQRRAHSIVLDVAGVATIDSQVAQALVQTAQALRLLGCQVIITGISAEVAGTLVAAGVALEGVAIARSPQQALERGLL